MHNIRYSQYFKGISLITDLLVTVSVIICFVTCCKSDFKINGIDSVVIIIKAHYKVLFLILFSWILIANYVRLYKSYRFAGALDIVRRIFLQMMLFSVLILAIHGIKKNLFSSLNSVFICLGIIFLILFTYRLISIFVFKRYRTLGYNSRKVVVIGENTNTESLIDLIESRKDYGFKLVDYFFKKEDDEFNLNWLAEQFNEKNLHIVYISLGGNLSEKEIKSIIELAQSHYLNVYFIPNSYFNIQSNLKVDYLDTFPILKFSEFPLDLKFNRLKKRVFDIAFSLLVLIVIFSWLFPILVILIILDSKGPIFFIQKRNGLNGKVFGCYKFRTMRPNKESDIKPTERNDPRITKVGAILRKTSIDELPQFFNVLLGHMSIVGPRPHMIAENQKYQKIINEYALRHFVKPGITGLAQMRGYRGKIYSNKDMMMRVKSDVYYIKRWSFILDIYIIIRTAINVIIGDKNAF